MNPAKQNQQKKTDVTFSVDLACVRSNWLIPDRALDARRMGIMREKQGNMRACRIKQKKRMNAFEDWRHLEK